MKTFSRKLAGLLILLIGLFSISSCIVDPPSAFEDEVYFKWNTLAYVVQNNLTLNAGDQTLEVQFNDDRTQCDILYGMHKESGTTTRHFTVTWSRADIFTMVSPASGELDKEIRYTGTVADLLMTLVDFTNNVYYLMPTL